MAGKPKARRDSIGADAARRKITAYLQDKGRIDFQESCLDTEGWVDCLLRLLEVESTPGNRECLLLAVKTLNDRGNLRVIRDETYSRGRGGNLQCAALEWVTMSELQSVAALPPVVPRFVEPTRRPQPRVIPPALKQPPSQGVAEAPLEPPLEVAEVATEEVSSQGPRTNLASRLTAIVRLAQQRADEHGAFVGPLSDVIREVMGDRLTKGQISDVRSILERIGFFVVTKRGRKPESALDMDRSEVTAEEIGNLPKVSKSPKEPKPSPVTADPTPELEPATPDQPQLPSDVAEPSFCADVVGDAEASVKPEPMLNEQVLAEILGTAEKLATERDTAVADLRAAQSELAESRDNEDVLAERLRAASSQVDALTLEVGQLQQALRERDDELAEVNRRLELAERGPSPADVVLARMRELAGK